MLTAGAAGSAVLNVAITLAGGLAAGALGFTAGHSSPKPQAPSPKPQASSPKPLIVRLVDSDELGFAHRRQILRLPS